ncbi:efflux RND transporter periplasmic adaptor subunit [Enterovibrio sp. ZSDZ35]|uniref:Efflux RND transporter periplasmic adaptor subunit n=1 Tax=Enterovibrio qingdaonensis TaxID=2899818 RepID=A0ABT5QJD1_9GAMM|nr:efflux RND transporter periplasmic adaptor subunit [Enterovibrio sp. ZSDZ35]MDD1780585.1 efflux RND transporter periplasmic adaptor subunit [Enterovibrio sp. ZSDZ35]
MKSKQYGKHYMRGYFKSTFAILVLICAGAAGYFFYQKPPLDVSGVQVQRNDMAYIIRVTGEVINDRTVSLTALVNGRVEEVYVARGDLIKKDDTLASMDNRASIARLQRAQAVVQQQTVRLKEQQQRHSRLSELSDKKLVAVEALDQAQYELEAAQAAVAIAKADAQMSALEQDWQKLNAPFDAVIIEKWTESGQWVEAGTELFQLVAIEGWEIEANLDAVDSGRIHVGQRVNVSSDAFPNQVWQTQIHWIGPAIERTSERYLNTFPVRMGLGEEAPQLLLGQQLDIEIVIEERGSVLSLPYSALRERKHGVFEIALVEQGTIRLQPVESGLETDTHVEILSGVQEGQWVALFDSEYLENGRAVRLIEDDQN